MNHFPPCRTKDEYAIYPCHENCLAYNAYVLLFLLFVEYVVSMHPKNGVQQMVLIPTQLFLEKERIIVPIMLSGVVSMKTILLNRLDDNFWLFVEVVAWQMSLIVEAILSLLNALE